MSEMFRSEEARETIRGWFDRFEARIAVPVERFTVATSFGETHGLMAGPTQGEPLVVLHGAMASSAHVMPELGPLASNRRIIAFDVIGQSAMSADRRLDLSDDSYGRWFEEACDGAGLTSFDLLGVSWGGFVAMKGALHIPDRLRKLALLVPAGFVSGSAIKGFLKMGWPMIKQMRSPSADHLRKVVEPLFTTIDPLWEEFFGEALASYRMDMRVPPLWKSAAYSGPVLVLGAEEDLSFPGSKLVKRARELMPQAETVLLEGSKHCPPFTAEFREELAGRVNRFLG